MMNPFDELPEGPKASAQILALVIAVAVLILALVGLSMLVSPPAQAASFEDEAADICKAGCVLMSRADYETLRAVAGRRCEPEIRL